ncbi:MAG: F0F1 ATP synthase subunit gamma [Nanoarchaeota archaeon]
MSNLKQIQKEIDTTKSIKLITQALGDIATLKIKETRDTVSHNILFFREVAKVYKVVKTISLQHKTILPTVLKGQKLASTKVQKDGKNGKTLAVLITSSKHFYGDLEAKLSKGYLDQTEKLDCERIVVGSIGTEYLNSRNYPHPFEAYVFDREQPTFDEINSLSRKMFAYSKILVFHNKFNSLLDQSITISDLSATSLVDQKNQGEFFYILEPEVDKMLEFFETQLILLLLRAVFLEVDISHQAARMISMNQAENNADKILDKQNRQALQIRKQIINLQIIENFVALNSEREINNG